ncbi:hypothetical protein AUL39_00160 [Tractidigestivibacter scatoligenes]|uniref:Uncharacterized protein n=1 Tax=Tractidigestivibacter scatoligenes TaxID=1299998 RepID=A0A100YW72_TRASO|nr:hypothetical protein [Tractidigestivibacter scatoligenes]KUH58810.1 hypothetical protein AUL39_00160 [Tractidigestivibacter scatoligenes]
MSNTAASVQINVRMDKALRDAGDAGLAAMGVSPTQAVRAVWRLAASGPAGIDALEQLFAVTVPASGTDQSPNENPLHQGWGLFSAACGRLGLDANAAEKDATPHSSDAELLEKELLARFGGGTQ